MLQVLLFVSVMSQHFVSSDALWAEVKKAHQGFKSAAYSFRKVRLSPKPTKKPDELGALTFARNGPYRYDIRDNVAGINAEAVRDKSGQSWVGARDDENSRNAQGYGDYLSNKWSYLPLDLMEGHESWIKLQWSGGPPTDATFRKAPCYLLKGKANPAPSGSFAVKIWIERKSLTLLRVEEDDGKNRWVTAFENQKFKK